MRYGTKKTLPHRDTTRMINIGGVVIGGGNPIAIQSMTNTETSDVDATVAQILELEKAGCQIIRSTANTEAAAKAFDKIKEQIHIAIVADIHFDYRLAILAMEYGADKIRINPGNIGGEENLKKVVKVAKERNIPIRVGVNSGSLERNLVEKYGGVTAEGIVESALDKVRMIEECPGFVRGDDFLGLWPRRGRRLARPEGQGPPQAGAGPVRLWGRGAAVPHGGDGRRGHDLPAGGHRGADFRQRAAPAQRDRLLRHRRGVPVLFDRHPAAAARQGKVNITSLSRNWREGRAKGCRRFAAALFRGDLTKRPSRATIGDGK